MHQPCFNNLEGEIWKPYFFNRRRTYYQISNMGRVCSIGKKRLRLRKLQTNRDGYIFTDFRIEKKRHYAYIHQLVGKLFIPNPKKLSEINHIDGVKMNNCVENLEWSTRSLNLRHAVKLGLITHKRGIEHHAARKVGKYFAGILLKTYNTIRDTKKDGFCENNVSFAVRHGSTSKGFNWKYLD